MTNSEPQRKSLIKPQGGQPCTSTASTAQSGCVEQRNIGDQPTAHLKWCGAAGVVRKVLPPPGNELEPDQDQSAYGYATGYKKSVHAKCFLNSWYFRGYGPRYGMRFRSILRYATLFAAILGPECLVDFLFKVFLIFGSVPVVS